MVEGERKGGWWKVSHKGVVWNVMREIKYRVQVTRACAQTLDNVSAIRYTIRAIRYIIRYTYSRTYCAQTLDNVSAIR